MVKISYGIVGKEIGINDKTCGIKVVPTRDIINYLNNNIIIIPSFQREIQQDKVDNIVNEYKTKHINEENYLIKHGYTLSLCKLTNNKELYVIDGMHRLEAVKILYNQRYDPDIIVRIQLCSNIEQIKRDFQLLNSNSNMPLMYTYFENTLIQNMLIDLKNLIKTKYINSFNKSKADRSISHRYHLDSFMELFQIDKIKDSNLTDANIILLRLEEINNTIKNKFNNTDIEQIKWYITDNDYKNIRTNDFYLCLSNIDWIDNFFDQEQIINYKPIRYKKTKIPKPLSKKVYDRDFGAKYNIGNCFVCQTEISRDSGHVGHIIPEYLNGPTQLDNLKAICMTCNLSIGIQNLLEYKSKFFP